jgi:hypothetical protein
MIVNPTVTLNYEIRQRGDGTYFVRVDVISQNPRLELGTFFLEGVKNPIDLKERLPKAMEEFYKSIEGKSWPITN